MVFSSSIFLLLFLPIFLIVYSWMPARWKNAWILLSSIFFYAWGEPRFILTILAVLSADFYIVRALSTSDDAKRRVGFLTISLVLKLSLLVYFKYSNFLVVNVSVIAEQLGFSPVTMAKIILPVGISFFTFQSITYTVDVYRKVSTPLEYITDYFLYILLFPQLIAGPIVRYNDIAPQLRDRSANETMDNRLLGLYRFMIGLSKKVFIANVLGEQADLAFNGDISALGASGAWFGALCYTMQIYFDFSGYSDMAIGIGRMIGFKFPENFDNPYVSRSISEFWRRWHITLGRFMRDYLYIPLGGNRSSSQSRIYFNLWIVFLLSGLWHGAGWTFIIWGAYHGLFLILDRLFLIKWTERLGPFFSIPFTFFLTIIGWVFFRANDLNDAMTFLGQMFDWSTSGQPLHIMPDVLFILCLALLFSFFRLSKVTEKVHDFFFNRERYTNPTHVAMILGTVVLLFFNISFITSSGFNPFIYFRF